MNITPAQISSTLAQFEEHQLERKLELRRLIQQAAREGRLAKRQSTWIARLQHRLQSGSTTVRPQQAKPCKTTVATTSH